MNVPITSSLTSSGSTSSESKSLIRIGCENTGTSRSRHSPPAGSASLFFTTIDAIDDGSLWLVPSRLSAPSPTTRRMVWLPRAPS